MCGTYFSDYLMHMAPVLVFVCSYIVMCDSMSWYGIMGHGVSGYDNAR